MTAIYLMLIILVITWFFASFQIYDTNFSKTTKAICALLVSIAFAVLSFLVIIYGPSKLV